jgi:hypothetical protein
MAKRIISRAVMTGMLLGAFGLGYLCGSVSWQRADAQISERKRIFEPFFTIKDKSQRAELDFRLSTELSNITMVLLTWKANR